MNELKRVFTARAVAIITVGSVIGSGIFLVPSGVLRDSGGSIGVATAVWIVGGVLSFLGALAYAELAAMNPGPGGLYLYLRDAFGDAVAFGYGWTLFVVIGSGTVAALSVGATNYLSEWIPMAPWVRTLVAAGLALAVSWVNVLGTERGAAIIKGGMVLKLAAIVLLVVALPALGSGWRSVGPIWPSSMTLADLGHAGLAMVSVLWAYEGWQYLTFIAGETIDPQRNFPKGLALGTALLIVIYVAAATAYVAGIGPEAVIGSNRVAADAARTVIGPSWGKIITLPIIISMLTAAQSNAMMSARVYYAMAKNGVFFKPMAGLHPRFGTPAVALIAIGVWAAVLAASGTFELLLSYVIFVGWIFYALGGLAVVVLRRTKPNAPRPYRVPGYPVTPLLFVLSGLAIVVNTIAADPRKGAIGVGATLVAIPVYYAWRRLARTPP